MTEEEVKRGRAIERIADRPKMAAGYLQGGLLPWSWVDARLTRARNYWIATVTAKGRPYSRPVWAIWLDETLYFSTGESGTRRNLDRGTEVSVNLESGDECVILEGRAEVEQDVAHLRRVVGAYTTKYGWPMEPKIGEWYAIAPRVVFAWISDGTGEDRGVTFSSTATRFRFVSPDRAT